LTNPLHSPEDARMNSSQLERLWDTGQRHLVAGRYVSARQHLRSAEALAWRHRDPGLLARIHLPLMEASRQIRQNAVEGPIFILSPHIHVDAARADATYVFLNTPPRVRRSAFCVEALSLQTISGQTHLNSPAALRFADGLPIRFTTSPAEAINPLSPMPIPLPPVNLYYPNNPLHSLARESLLIAWEVLALHWQSRHPLPAAPPSPATAWEELAWLRRTLLIDPACEPAAMRLIALAESVERNTR